ncbi:hypothetical protein ACIQ1S_36915, partial [Streptomyces griseus]|uniref:hypothetical protein n=1 Tax=Streptomyces griseus TaxID=1911 RepID=UPI0037F1F686
TPNPARTPHGRTTTAIDHATLHHHSKKSFTQPPAHIANRAADWDREHAWLLDSGLFVHATDTTELQARLRAWSARSGIVCGMPRRRRQARIAFEL